MNKCRPVHDLILHQRTLLMAGLVRFSSFLRLSWTHGAGVCENAGNAARRVTAGSGEFGAASCRSEDLCDELELER